MFILSSLDEVNTDGGVLKTAGEEQMGLRRYLLCAT